MKRRAGAAVMVILTAFFLTSCGTKTELQDGYYTSQACEFHFGWREYITIIVKGGSIVSVEYNAENESGFIKSWDNSYMQNMLHTNGTYPNEFMRFYAGELFEKQGKEQIDALSGATSSYNSFQQLAAAVVEQARRGDSSIVLVDIKEE